MKKLLFLSMLIVLLAPLSAHALLTNDEILSYAAMPLAVSNVCDVRGVQTDEVGNLVAYMDRANVPPDQFIDVFRYVPVALTLNSGHRPDFVQWVGSEVDQGVMGDQLVTVMEQRLTTYGNVVTVSQFRHHRRHRYYRPIYQDVYDPYYVPATVVRYVDYEMLDPFALIDEPVAVANVVDLGIPIARIGNFVLQLDLAGVAPVQTVELLRYAPTPLMAVNYGYPDFVQYVYDQRVNGVTGYGLVQAIDQQLPVYGVAPQIDLAPPVYVGANTYVPSVVNDYVQPVDTTWVPPAVRTQMASFAAPGSFAAPSSFAPSRGAFVPQQAPAAIAPQFAPSVAATSPQVQRLLQQQGNPVVTNPAQARRELAQSMREQRQAMRAQRGFAPSPIAPAPQFSRVAPPGGVAAMRGNGNGRGREMAMSRGQGRAFASQPVQMAQPAPTSIARGQGHGRAMRMAQRPAQMMQQPAQTRVARGQGHGRAMRMAQPVMAAPAPVMSQRPQMMRQRGPQGPQEFRQRGRSQAAPRPMFAAPPPRVERAPVMASPQFVPPQVQRQGRGHGGPPARVMAPPAAAAAPAAVAAPQGPAARGNGNGNGNGQNGKRKGKGE